MITFIPSFLSPPPRGLNLSDQFAFQPTGSTTSVLIHLFHTISTLLESNQYIIVFALDISEAFDSVRHRQVMDKFSKLVIADSIYNLAKSFFRRHSHGTKFAQDISGFQEIMANIIQGSCTGPASYVVTAYNLHPITEGNTMDKYTDDTYLIVPTSNFWSCVSEINNTELWASKNNLQLDRSKSTEIVFMSPRCRQDSTVRPNTFGFARIESVEALGVLFTWKLSVKLYIDELLAACAKQCSLCAHWGNMAYQVAWYMTFFWPLPSPSYHMLPQPGGDMRAQLMVPSSRHFFNVLSDSVSNLPRHQHLQSMCALADDQLSAKIINDSRYLLRPILPPTRVAHYHLWKHLHNLELPARSSSLSDRGFIMRIIHKDTGDSVRY